MTNKFDEMREAVREAEQQLRAADSYAHNMAKHLVGRLRMVNRDNNFWSNEILADLKRELADYNIRTGEWK